MCIAMRFSACPLSPMYLRRLETQHTPHPLEPLPGPPPSGGHACSPAGLASVASYRRPGSCLLQCPCLCPLSCVSWSTAVLGPLFPGWPGVRLCRGLRGVRLWSSHPGAAEQSPDRPVPCRSRKPSTCLCAGMWMGPPPPPSRSMSPGFLTTSGERGTLAPSVGVHGPLPCAAACYPVSASWGGFCSV